ncbi:quinolinate synthase NadA [Eubacteriaceae bacterium ES3]|nr:quinolinate synthase NadA [Eubacteriaceae bacterium ES3]
MENLVERIKVLKEERDAVILSHFYTHKEVQEISDYVGDSYYLSRLAKDLPQQTIVFCGVSFMAESAKMLSPQKTVLMPDLTADCPMAHMATEEKIKAAREKYDDLAVVCYINSTSEIKQYVDVCVTSSNAKKIVAKLPQKNIYFIPDQNLGAYLASQIPEKNFILNDGFCHVHQAFTVDSLKKKKGQQPEAKVLVHPEAPMEVLEMADYIGSTGGIIDYANQSDDSVFIVLTEEGILTELEKKNPDKVFLTVENEQICPDMKKISLEKIKDVLEKEQVGVQVDEQIRAGAVRALDQMLELAL